MKFRQDYGKPLIPEYSIEPADDGAGQGVGALARVGQVQQVGRQDTLISFYINRLKVAL